ncbi:MAG: hypothetical protein MUO31_14885, partial [Thermodesulfovibrionales bacterium]|nr:hypothetical protein [Thermodesulfovibrionales bacterium]
VLILDDFQDIINLSITIPRLCEVSSDAIPLGDVVMNTLLIILEIHFVEPDLPFTYLRGEQLPILLKKGLFEPIET